MNMTWQFSQKHVKATTFYRECYTLLKMCNFRLRAEGFCIAHPLPAVELWCFYESDEYLNFWGNYMTLNETKRTSAKLKYAGAMKDVMSTAKQIPHVCVSLLFCQNFRSPKLIFVQLYSCLDLSVCFLCVSHFNNIFSISLISLIYNYLLLIQTLRSTIYSTHLL